MVRDFQEGILYGMCRYTEPGVIIYTGSTTSPLNVRFNRHKGAFKKGKNFLLYNAIREDPLGWNNYYMQLIEYYPCNSRDELESREGELQKIIKPPLNKNMAGRKRDELIQTDEYIEYFKAYKASHKEEQKSYMVKFFLNNPGYRKIKHDEFHLRNPGYQKIKNDEYRLRQKELKEAVIL
jgi:hypothetical protein